MNPVYSEIKSESTSFYMNSFDLVPNLYKIYWNSTQEKFIIEIHLRINGWFAFGFR